MEGMNTCPLLNQKILPIIFTKGMAWIWPHLQIKVYSITDSFIHLIFAGLISAAGSRHHLSAMGA